MATRAVLLALTLVAAGFAGCVGGGDDGSGSTVEPTATNDTSPDTNETQPNVTQPSVSTTWKNGTINGGSFTGGYYCAPQGPCDNTLEFDVSGSKLTALVVEVAWNASANMYLNVTGPCQSFAVLFESCRPGASTEGSSPLKLTFSQEKLGNHTGTWTAEVWVDAGTPTTVDYTMTASVISQAPPPEGFSKLGS